MFLIGSKNCSGIAWAKGCGWCTVAIQQIEVKEMLLGRTRCSDSRSVAISLPNNSKQQATQGAAGRRRTGSDTFNRQCCQTFWHKVNELVTETFLPPHLTKAEIPDDLISQGPIIVLKGEQFVYAKMSQSVVWPKPLVIDDDGLPASSNDQDQGLCKHPPCLIIKTYFAGDVVESDQKRNTTVLRKDDATLFFALLNNEVSKKSHDTSGSSNRLLPVREAIIIDSSKPQEGETNEEEDSAVKAKNHNLNNNLVEAANTARSSCTAADHSFPKKRKSRSKERKKLQALPLHLRPWDCDVSSLMQSHKKHLGSKRL
jgi:hypothetical protein